MKEKCKAITVAHCGLSFLLLPEDPQPAVISRLLTPVSPRFNPSIVLCDGAGGDCLALRETSFEWR